MGHFSAEIYASPGSTLSENQHPQFSTQHREKEARRIIPALVVGDGRVPVHLVTGQGDILSHARKIRQKLSGRGYLFHITAAAYSEHPDGTELIMAGKSLFDRIIALTLRNDVQGIIVAEQMQTILSEGLAVDQFARAYVIDSDRHRGRQLRRVLQTRLPIRSCQLLEQKI